VILEGIVTTVDPEGVVNVAPMGPRVEPDFQCFLLRPFKTSTTYRNLKATGAGVIHVTDDVLLLARTAIGLPADPRMRPAREVRGWVLEDACRYYEFRVTDLDDREERTSIRAETVVEGHQRDFFGFNRAKHAVVEAAILATRVEILPLDEILEEFRRLTAPVEKTGGPAERAAFDLLLEYVREAARRHGLDPARSAP
jgi:hypothetical protein